MMTVTVSYAIYPRECIAETSAAYSGLCSTVVREEREHECVLDINSHSEFALHEFLNALLDISVARQLQM